VSARDELANLMRDTDLIGCGCCARSTEVQVGPEEWDVEYPDRVDVLAEAILAAGYVKQESPE